MKMSSERQLQLRVVAYLRESHPWVPLIPGLGEHQTTYGRRVDAWQKGYISGVPDLLLLVPSGDSSGLAIEFKSPKYRKGPSATQIAFLRQLETVSRFQTLVSHDYDAIVSRIDRYLASADRSESALSQEMDRFAFDASHTPASSDEVTPE
jgi:hypothetical protein